MQDTAAGADEGSPFVVCVRWTSFMPYYILGFFYLLKKSYRLYERTWKKRKKYFGFFPSLWKKIMYFQLAVVSSIDLSLPQNFFGYYHFVVFL